MAARRARQSGSWMVGGKFKTKRRNLLDPIPKYREHNGVSERTERMKVGQLAEAVGVSVQAIRFYERRGLLPAPPRLTSGYRDYPSETVRTVLLIKQMQGLGFTLRELENFIRLLESRSHDPAERRQRV